MFTKTAGLTSLLLWAASRQFAAGFDYAISSVGSVELMDIETEIPDIKTIFLEDEMSISATGIEWEFTGNETGTDMTVTCEAILDGEVVGTDTMSLEDVGRMLPSSMDCGTFSVGSKGKKVITLQLTLDGATASTDRKYQAFRAGTSIIPLLVIIILAASTSQVELSLSAGIFMGAWIIAGNLLDGYVSTLEDYILANVASTGHGYVYLFVLFMSGLVGMLERSGGMMGFAKEIAVYAKDARSGQFATFFIGLLVFFDDYGNTLLAGLTMRPLADVLNISREKLAFVVDATAAPIASLTPISSWVGFEVEQIQTQLDRLVTLYGDDLIVSDSGLGAFLQTIKYRYYPIFMLIMMPMLIYTQRDFGPMLIAERKTQVYERTDGGDGAATKKAVGEKNKNAAPPGQPMEAYNMLLPIALLVFFIFYIMIQTGTIDGEEQDFMDKLQGADAYAALLRGTMATGICTYILYIMQPVQDGKVVWPKPDIVFKCLDPRKNRGDDEDEDEEEHDDEAPPKEPRSLMGLFTCIDAYLFGMGRIFPALIILTLAWSSGAVMTDLGVDRLFSALIVGSIKSSSLPTLVFVVCSFVSLSLGTSWGTMAIMFPLLTVPAYRNLIRDDDLSNDDIEIIFYATLASVLSGAVYGDHVSPISDTTVLSSLSTDCKLLGHVSTQIPYATFASLIGILFGTLPIGGTAWPNFVGLGLGTIVIVIFVFFFAQPVISKTGRYDLINELILKVKGGDKELDQLRQDCIERYNNGPSERKIDQLKTLGLGGGKGDEDVPKEKDVPSDVENSNDTPPEEQEA